MDQWFLAIVKEGDLDRYSMGPWSYRDRFTEGDGTIDGLKAAKEEKIRRRYPDVTKVEFIDYEGDKL